MPKKTLGVLVIIVFICLIAAQESSDPTVQLAQHETLGDFLTDARGMSLYLFTKDAPNTSNCYDQCAENWPPLLTTSDLVTGGEGLDAMLLGTAKRIDGSSQVTYNGWPLYYFAADQNPGDVKGQAVGEVWYLVSGEGEAIGVEGNPSTEGAEQADTGGGGDLAQLISAGESIYMDECSKCHKADGSGGEGPDLHGNSKLDPARRPIRQVIHGGHFMPAFGDLSDGEVAAVVTYIRNSWGNNYGLVTAEEVSQEREE